jgi:hypothetical protein
MTRIFGVSTDCGEKAGSMAPGPLGHGDIKHGDLIVELQASSSSS